MIRLGRRVGTGERRTAVCCRLRERGGGDREAFFNEPSCRVARAVRGHLNPSGSAILLGEDEPDGDEDDEPELTG